jgi:acyl-CoA synthetase (AMP-forming)/AMP-acid ligase II
MSKRIWTSPYAPLEPEDVAVDELVLRDAPERTALIDGASGEALSYAELAARTDRVAGALAARAFGPGDVLAVRAPNAPPWIIAALGAIRAGGAVTGIGVRASRRELAAQLADAGASILATMPELAAEAPGATEAIAFDELLHGHGSGPLPDSDPSRVAFLPYSSGTTGLPKGVMLTHANLVAASGQLGRGLRLGERDTVLALAPLAHVMGFVVSTTTPLVAGATIVTLPRFELEAILAAVERHRITVLPVPPPVFAALAHQPAVDGYDLSSLELIVSGGAPIGPDLQRELADRFPGVAVAQGYGLTETTALIPTPDRDGTVPGSVGRIAPNTELRVVDPATGTDLGAGERGELWARGPQVMAGYLGRPDATAQMIDADGWLRTGDVGIVDAEGNVFVVDRIKELIKVNAHQVPPAELEALLVTHPAVADAAVFPRPDERTGQVPVAAVVARGELDPDELMAWVAERVSPHKRLRDVRLVEAIPRTPSGKILRRVLIEAMTVGLRGC